MNCEDCKKLTSGNCGNHTMNRCHNCGRPYEPKDWEKELRDKKTWLKPMSIDELVKYIKNLLSSERQRLIKEFTEGKRCFTCGELKGEGGELSDTCLKCLENE